MSLAARLLGASAWRANLPRCASACHPLLAGPSSSPSHDASSVKSAAANAVSAGISRASVAKGAGGSAATWAGASVFRGFAASAAASGKDAGASASSSGASASPSSSSSDAEEASSEQPEGANVSAEELLAQLKEKESAMDKLREQVESATDHWKRSLAEMENVRQRTAREVDNSKKFAIQGFVKSILDVVDNLERAAGVVPQDALSPDSQVDKEKLRALLKGLLDGVQATEKIMLQVLKQHNVERYDPLNQQFDPTLHNALFEVPDPTKAPGTVAVVTKRGYKLNDRVVRPADVGVVRAAE